MEQYLPQPEAVDLERRVYGPDSGGDKLTEIEGVKSAILAKLTLAVGRSPANATDRDWYMATALAARDRVVFRWMESNRRTRIANSKRVYYLSLEFLIGRMLREVVSNLRVDEVFKSALGDLGVDFDRIL